MDGKAQQRDGWINGQSVKGGRGHTSKAEKNGKKPGSGEKRTGTASASALLMLFRHLWREHFSTRCDVLSRLVSGAQESSAASDGAPHLRFRNPTEESMKEDRDKNCDKVGDAHAPPFWPALVELWVVVLLHAPRRSLSDESTPEETFHRCYFSMKPRHSH